MKISNKEKIIVVGIAVVVVAILVIYRISRENQSILSADQQTMAQALASYAKEKSFIDKKSNKSADDPAQGVIVGIGGLGAGTIARVDFATGGAKFTHTTEIDTEQKKETSEDIILSSEQTSKIIAYANSLWKISSERRPESCSDYLNNVTLIDKTQTRSFVFICPPQGVAREFEDYLFSLDPIKSQNN